MTPPLGCVKVGSARVPGLVIPLGFLTRWPHEPAIPPLLKDLNERTVLETIRAGAPISRAEISRRAGISKPTVSLALAVAARGGDRPRGRPRARRAELRRRVLRARAGGGARCSGSTSARHFLRGAVCDLDGSVRAREDVQLRRRGAEPALDAIASLASSLLAGAELADGLVDGVVVGVPGVVLGDAADRRWRRTSPVSRAATSPASSPSGSACRSRSRTTSTSRRSASSGRASPAASTTSSSSRSARASGPGSCCGASCTGATTAPPASSTTRSAASAPELDPCAGAVVDLAEQLGAARHVAGGARSRRPTRARCSPRRAPATRSPAQSSPRPRGGSRCTSRRSPAVADVDLVVLGGGIGSNGDLLLDPIRALLRDWLPYPPRVEVSSLGDGAVLTGALSLGLRAALDSVFVNRRSSRRPLT